MDVQPSDLVRKLQSLGLSDARVTELARLFDAEIDLGATIQLHAESFQEFVTYMENYIAPYTVDFEGSDTKWVPMDLLKHTFRHDPNFRFRLIRFVKGMTERDYREEDEENLSLDNIGTQFLSWDMVLPLMVLNGVAKAKGKGKAAPKREAITVNEVDVQEEPISAQGEASMALLLLQDVPEETPDTFIEGEEAIEEAPELELISLHAIIVDGIEFLLLDDISKTLGLREDEALSIIAMYAGMRDDINPTGDHPFQLDFEDNSLTKALAYQGSNNEQSLVEIVANTLVEIKSCAEFYESIPDEAFLPHHPVFSEVMHEQPKGSIDLRKDKVIEADDAVEVCKSQPLIVLQA